MGGNGNIQKSGIWRKQHISKPNMWGNFQARLFHDQYSRIVQIQPVTWLDDFCQMILCIYSTLKISHLSSIAFRYKLPIELPLILSQRGAFCLADYIFRVHIQLSKTFKIFT